MHKLFFLFVFISFTSVAQSSKVSAGVNDYEKGRYSEAIVNFYEALERPSQLKELDLHKAWLYRGKALVDQYQAAINAGDKEKVRLYFDNLLLAYDCFQNAFKATNSKQATAATLDEMKLLVPKMFNLGTIHMSSKNHADAQKHFNNCKEASKSMNLEDDYLYFDVSGQNLLALKDSSQALLDFTTAIAKYTSNPSTIPDALIGYSFYRSSIIHRYEKEDLESALAVIDQGIALMETENNRRAKLLLKATDEMIVNRLKQSESMFAQTIADLKGFQLDILLNSPERYVEALERFKNETAANPKDETIKIAYGNLLEQSDPDAGYEVYADVLKINPNNLTALFNAGANRVNKGVYYANLSNEEIDFTRANEWREKMKECFKIALPHFQKYDELKPDDLMALNALIQVTIQLNMTTEYDKYVERRKILRGF